MDLIERRNSNYTIGGILIIMGFPLIIYFIASQFTWLLANTVLRRSISWFWLILVYLYAVVVEKQKFLLWKRENRTIIFYIIAFISVLMLSYLSNVAVQLLLNKIGFKEHTSHLLKRMVEYYRMHPYWMVMGCATAGITEELVFRGYLIPRLSILFKNKYLPVLLSALLFGAIHFGYGTLHNMIGPFIMGIVSGAYYQKYKDLKVLIACHFCIDLISLMLMEHLWK